MNADWGTGFSVAITITNPGSALTNWTLRYSYSGSPALAQGWDGNWSQSGSLITVTNAAWNSNLATGASVELGANFTGSPGSAPTDFTVSGTPCNGSGTGGGCGASAPAVAITSPVPDQVVTEGGTITVAAATDPACGITSVAFYASNSGTGPALSLGTAAVSPFSVQWADVPFAGYWSVYAVAAGAGGQTYTSAPVRLNVFTPATLPPAAPPESE